MPSNAQSLKANGKLFCLKLTRVIFISIATAAETSFYWRRKCLNTKKTVLSASVDKTFGSIHPWICPLVRFTHSTSGKTHAFYSKWPNVIIPVTYLTCLPLLPNMQHKERMWRLTAALLSLHERGPSWHSLNLVTNRAGDNKPADWGGSLR